MTPCRYCGESTFLHQQGKTVSCWNAKCPGKQARFRVVDWGDPLARPLLNVPLSPVIQPHEIERSFDPNRDY